MANLLFKRSLTIPKQSIKENKGQVDQNKDQTLELKSIVIFYRDKEVKPLEVSRRILLKLKVKSNKHKRAFKDWRLH